MSNIQPPMEHFERPDPVLTNKIVTHLKSQGIFDQFRRECMADVDTKPAYHNLRQRVEGSVAAFLRMNPWRPDMNKNQLRDNLRKHIQSGGFLDIGVDRIVDQVVNPKIYTVFLPKVEEVVQSCLGIENNKPIFEPPPPTEVKSEPPKFQDKHNLAPRAKLPAPLMGPLLKPLKPADQVETRLETGREKLTDNGGDTDTEDKKYVVDEDDIIEKEEDEDDEESPPFEPHSEGDRLILGMRSDSSENSNDSQVVTTIVDDNLEERIDNNETNIKEESDKKDDDSSSDEYVPKTPTINMEELDGTVLEFNSISEYKHYQTKFEEEHLGNIEEVISSQSLNNSREPVNKERSCNEVDSTDVPQKRKFNIDSYDDASSSSSDKESTSDEIKPAVFELFKKKRFKLEEYENETSEMSVNDMENEDLYIERSMDMADSKIKVYGNEHHVTNKGGSTSSKDSGKCYQTHYKENTGKPSHHGFKDETLMKEHQEKIRSSHSSKDKKDIYKKSVKHESSKHRHKERDRKRSGSSSKLSEKDSRGRSKHYDKERERDKKRSKSSERLKKEKEDTNKNKKETGLEQNDHQHESKSSEHDKEKKKHSSRDENSDGKEDHDTSHKSDKDKRDNSKPNHCSSRHRYRSSSEKHKSDKDYKCKRSSDDHKSHDKKIGKDESKKKYRQHCKYTNDKDENRRSSDRDSSGPSARSHMSSSSKSTSSRTHGESKIETGERTTSNSDNTVSDNIEAFENDSKIDSTQKRELSSPDRQLVDETWNESGFEESEFNSSKEEIKEEFLESETNSYDSFNKTQDKNNYGSESRVASKEILDSSGLHLQPVTSEDQIVQEKNDFVDALKERTADVKVNSDTKKDSVFPSASLHDSSSEKENIEHDEKEQFDNEFNGNNTDTSLEEDSTAVKFKKPKIAKNIHEVKKIMEARRHLKRMEKKRIKLLTKNNPEEYESDEKSPSEDRLEDESEEDVFRGFEDDFSSEKIRKYDCLTKRLEREAFHLEKSVNYEKINSNLITSWVDLNPDLDNYIETTLKGKVHRKYRVHLPPICDEYYNYDSKQNVYLLVKNLDVTQQKEVLVDSNLNNLNSDYTTDQQENQICNEVKSKRKKLSEVPIPCTNSKIIHEARDPTKQNSRKHKTSHKKKQSNFEVINILDESIVPCNDSGKRINKDVNEKMDNSSNVIASPQIVFNLTFNQTYDEVLKEKAQNSVVPVKKEVEETYKTPLTVVKITNNQTSEEVFMKKIQANSEDKVQVPRITRSETFVNGKITETQNDSKQIPFISRITKDKKISTPSTTKDKFHSINGIMSQDSTTNFEEKFPREVTQKIINEVIGIQDTVVLFDQGDISDQSSQSGEESSDPRRKRTKGCKQQQRYDSSDLYKPRLQLSSRRIRAMGSSPEETCPIPQALGTRKRSATSVLNTSVEKRRR